MFGDINEGSFDCRELIRGGTGGGGNLQGSDLCSMFTSSGSTKEIALKIE